MSHTGTRRGEGPSRRSLLAAATLGLAGAAWSPRVSAVALGRALGLAGGAAGATDDRRLVLLFLEGGNDGLNTVVPFTDDAYQRARPGLALQPSTVHRLDDQQGLHPSLAAWRRLFDSGRLAVIQGVGMERPNRSHFVARDVWHSGHRDLPQQLSGWIGRALDEGPPGSLPGVSLGVDEAPLILAGKLRAGLTLGDGGKLSLQGSASGALLARANGGVSHRGEVDFIARVAASAYDLSARWEQLLARAPAGSAYPDTRLGDRLRLAARLARAPGGPAAIWCTLGGFDTHALQAGTHGALLAQLGEASAAFVDDLAADGSDRRVTLLIYSEFGRRVQENGSQGTDHGVAAPLFALGGAIEGGLHGPPPDLEQLLDGDIAPSVDFRAVFAEAARWMGWDAVALFGEPAPSWGSVGLFS